MIVFITMFKYCLFILCMINLVRCGQQYGPDPWEYEGMTVNHDQTPPDLRQSVKRKESLTNNGGGEWFFRRILAIMIKNGQSCKDADDGSIEVHFKLSKENKETIEKYLKSENSFTKTMYREALGYVEESIYKPSVIDIIVMTWSEYIYSHLQENKFVLTWTLVGASVVWILMVVSKHVSRLHIVMILCLLVYFYEAFISYKEAERKEYDQFVSALNKCNWYFWSTKCEVPTPDPTMFLKHMHPMKIGLRIFTMLISEPMLAMSFTIQQMLHGLTDDLWFPLNTIVYICLILLVNIFLIMLLLMILFNFILNIPFNLSFFAGLVNIGIKERRSYLGTGKNRANSKNMVQIDNSDKISGQNLDKLLSIFAQGIGNPKQTSMHLKSIKGPQIHKGMKRSSSTGRLPDTSNSYEGIEYHGSGIRHRRTNFEMGSGDGLRR